MALTYAALSTSTVPGDRKVRVGTLTFDSSYPTGGEAVTIASLGLTTLEAIIVNASGGYNAVWDRSVTAPKILVYVGDNDAGADGPGAQVANTTDLSAVVVTYLAIGR